MKTIFYFRFACVVCLFSTFFFPGFSQERESGSKTLEKPNVFKQEGVELRERSATPPEISVLLEYISLEASMASQLLAQYSSRPNEADALRDQLDQMTGNGEAKLEETMWVRAQSGKRCLTSSYLFDIYPREFDPPELPSYISAAQPGQEKHMTSANPTAWECRNVGMSLEVDPVLSGDQRVIQLHLSPEIVERVGETYYTMDGYEKDSPGIEHVVSPLFYTIKDMLTMDVTPGQYAILGIHKAYDEPNRRILVLVRADLISFD